jgi:undecaprenyl-diphosphatase
VGQGSFAFGVIVVVIVGIVFAARYLRVPEHRQRLVDWMERSRALRPVVRLGRRLSPAGRFAWQRVTPGPLGLQLTTLLAVLAVGLYVLIGYTLILSDDPGPTPGDQWALDRARDLRSGWLTDAMRQLTKLGSGAVTLPLAAIASIALALRRRWPEVLVLVFGVAIAHVAVPDLKDAIDRARPADPIVTASASAFPSGHAANSVLYVWLAATVAWRISPGLAIRSVVVAAGFAIAALVGLSRVYLGVHFMSDVAAGWALGLTAFALCATIALVATHLRHNSAGHAPGEDRA